jgi:hypothetical protein
MEMAFLWVKLSCCCHYENFKHLERILRQISLPFKPHRPFNRNIHDSFKLQKTAFKLTPQSISIAHSRILFIKLHSAHKKFHSARFVPSSMNKRANIQETSGERFHFTATMNLQHVVMKLHMIPN